MKKLLSLALILALVATLTTSVFAANVVGGTVGVPAGSFPDTTDENTTVTINATVGTVQHRYAVDIAFTGLEVTVSGNELVWNAQTLEYESSGSVTAPTDATGTVTFTNRSDLPVYVSYTVADEDANDLLTVTVAGETAPVNGKHEIKKSAIGTATDYVFDLTVVANGDNWEAVAEYYAGWFENNTHDGSRPIAKVTFTVSKDAPQP